LHQKVTKLLISEATLRFKQLIKYSKINPFLLKPQNPAAYRLKDYKDFKDFKNFKNYKDLKDLKGFKGFKCFGAIRFFS